VGGRIMVMIEDAHVFEGLLTFEGSEAFRLFFF
jgi:hypothetical protein